MKRIIFASLIIALMFSGIGYAEYTEQTKNNGVKHQIKSESQITSQPAQVSLEKGKELMSNIEVLLPTYLPKNYKMENVIYNEPPAEFKNGVKLNIEAHKAITIRYRNQNDPSNWIDYTTKAAQVIIGDNDTQDLMIQGVEGQILEYPDKEIIALSWYKNKTNHFIISKGNITKEEILKFAESLK